MRHATSLLYHVYAVASRNIRFARCATSGKLTLWTCLVDKTLIINKKLIILNSSDHTTILTHKELRVSPTNAKTGSAIGHDGFLLYSFCYTIWESASVIKQNINTNIWFILWHIYSMLGNDREIGNDTTATARQQLHKYATVLWYALGHR
jgi:hypothetical protein